MRIVLIGKPGSGKGTQAGLLKAEYKWPHLSSGAILREEIAEKTALGMRVEEFVLRGEIGPDKLITSALISYIERKECSQHYILDGFPRTLYQAEQLDGRFAPETAILFDIDDAVVIERLSRRRTCGHCGAIYNVIYNPSSTENVCDACGGSLAIRDDDREDAIKKRVEVFARQVTPVVDYYAKDGRLTIIDGKMHPAKVFRSVQKALSARSGRRSE